MSYRSILVFLDQDPTCEERAWTAIRLARKLDAHLVGLAPTGLVELPVTAEVSGTIAEFATLSQHALRDGAQRSAERFRGQCAAGGLKSFEAVVDEADPVQSLVRHVHCSDLAILSQADADAPDRRGAQDLVERVVLQSARPTLVLPSVGRFASVGQRAMVAWDDSREAARALADALPLLRGAETVRIVCWNEVGEEADEGLRPRLDALNRWLMWQGVTAEAAIETTQIDIADAMLSRASDMSADLIVMGAYGHARWAERMLGGATRGLLSSMTVPVLMSH